MPVARPRTLSSRASGAQRCKNDVGCLFLHRLKRKKTPDVFLDEREDAFELVVQVNGKTRGKIAVAKDVTQDAAVAAVHADPALAKFITGAPKKIIFVPGRLINIVV